MKFNTKSSMSMFLSGGNATFTLRNRETGNRYTYKVTRKKNGDIFWVKLLNGDDNTNSYRFFGTLFPGSTGLWLKHSDKGHISGQARSVLAFKWFLGRLRSDRSFPEEFEFWHEGKCARCGRKLTVPASLVTGFGPECVKKVA